MPKIADDEGGSILVAPATVSLSAAIWPTTFAAWAAQYEEDGAQIRGVYSSLDGATEANKEELQTYIALLEEGADIGLIF